MGQFKTISVIQNIKQLSLLFKFDLVLAKADIGH